MDGIEKTNGVAADSDERCPVEEVALVVPETDDQSLPVMTSGLGHLLAFFSQPTTFLHDR